MPSTDLASSGRQRTLAIAATFTAEPLAPALEYLLAHCGLGFAARFAPYHQVFQQLLAPGLLADNTAGVNVILVRIEDFVRDQPDPEVAATTAEKAAEDLESALEQAARNRLGPTIFCVLPTSPGTPDGLRGRIDRAGATLIRAASGIAGVVPLRAEEIDRVADAEAYDPVGERLAHMPYTEEHYAALALALVRKLHALVVPAQKVLALDCDNTLWRGVVGEDGIDGVEMTDACRRLQDFARSAQAAGTLICLVSKNVEADVLETLARRADMPLKSGDLVANRINWLPKSDNLRSLAAELDLGLDAFVFIDDSPVECAEVRESLPEVVTLQLPPAEEIERFLRHLWVFDRIAITDEDRRRTGMYRENAARRALSRESGSLAEFVASLRVIVDLAPPGPEDWPRLAQLTQRTNQFNFTTRRCSEPELRAYSGPQGIILAVRVSDRFGDYGLVGLVAGSIDGDMIAVDLFLLSCRVLGRGVEHAMVRQLGALAAERGLAGVEFVFRPTERNEPARAFAESLAETTGAVARSPAGGYRLSAAAARVVELRAAPAGDQTVDSVEAVAVPSSQGVTAAIHAPRSDRYRRLARELRSGSEVLAAIRESRVRLRDLPGAPVDPATPTERSMLALWEEVLGIRGLGVEDEFSALGGSSVLAARLFARIQGRFGVRLPLTTILSASTPRLLAASVLSGRQHSADVLVDLRPGGSETLFLVHDGDGETLLYLNLARRLPAEIGVVGIEPSRQPGIPLAHDRVEDIAARYVEAVSRRQPRGPYRLGGMCAGGVIAYEMTRQLRAAGETVDFLLLLDSAVPGATRYPRAIAGERLGRFAAALEDLRCGPAAAPVRALRFVKVAGAKVVNALSWEIGSRLRRTYAKMGFRLLRQRLAASRPWPRLLPPLTVREIYEHAESAYRPPVVPGIPVILVRASEGEGNDSANRRLFVDPQFGWERVVADLDVVDVPGGHASMLQEPYAASLAAAVAGCWRNWGARSGMPIRGGDGS